MVIKPLKSALKRRLPGTWLARYGETRELLSWYLQGRPLPPPHVYKRKTVLRYARRFRLRTLVETGTGDGTMVLGTLTSFEKIHTIELDDRLHEHAVKLFADSPHVELHRGDSSVRLAEVLAGHGGDCLFWLDGHWSGGVTARGPKDTPIAEELEAIFAHPQRGHVLLIDDARFFTGEDDYPALEVLKNRVLTARPGWSFQVARDIIRITPPRRWTCGRSSG
jgi:hypothetical protein